MAEYTCTIPAREYRELVSDSIQGAMERQRHRQTEAELAAVKVELDEMKKALEAEKADKNLFYHAWLNLGPKGENRDDAQGVQQ